MTVTSIAIVSVSDTLPAVAEATEESKKIIPNVCDRNWDRFRTNSSMITDFNQSITIMLARKVYVAS
eukprot:m.321562 g.321562  ORF g.321562 m.321562 type:complete len:67 (+) comp20337_c0_seq3:1238-1438(+)